MLNDQVTIEEVMRITLEQFARLETEPEPCFQELKYLASVAQETLACVDRLKNKNKF